MVELLAFVIVAALSAFGLISISVAIIAIISNKKTKEKIELEKEKFNKKF